MDFLAQDYRVMIPGAPDFTSVSYVLAFSGAGDAAAVLRALKEKRARAGAAPPLGRRLASSDEALDADGTTLRFRARVRTALLPRSDALDAMEAEMCLGGRGAISSRTII